MNNYTHEELSIVESTVNRLRDKLTPVQASNLERMVKVVLSFDLFLESYDKTPNAQDGAPLLGAKRQHQEGRFLVDMGSKYFPKRKLLMFSGSSVVDRKFWDFTDYCAAMSVIPEIYSALNGYNDLSDVNLWMAEGFINYIS